MPQNIYDDLDHLYREIWGTSLHHGLWIEGNEPPSLARENLVKLALSLLQPKGTIADIGCGYGILAHRLIREFDCKVIANTSSQVQQQRIEPHPSLTVLGGDWLHLDLPKDSLDGAIAIESFSHFPSFGAGLDKTINALKPGARLLIADWFSETGHHPLLRHLAKSGALPIWRSLDSLKSATTAQGFRVREAINLSSGAAPTWSHLFRAALGVLLGKPRLLPLFFSQLLRKPSLLWIFPLLRLAYETGDLEYHILLIEK